VSDILGQLVLKDVNTTFLSLLEHAHSPMQSPNAEVAIIEDHVWIGCVDSVSQQFHSQTLLTSYLSGFG